MIYLINYKKRVVGTIALAGVGVGIGFIGSNMLVKRTMSKLSSLNGLKAATCSTSIESSINTKVNMCSNFVRSDIVRFDNDFSDVNDVFKNVGKSISVKNKVYFNKSESKLLDKTIMDFKKNVGNNGILAQRSGFVSGPVPGPVSVPVFRLNNLIDTKDIETVNNFFEVHKDKMLTNLMSEDSNRMYKMFVRHFQGFSNAFCDLPKSNDLHEYKMKKMLLVLEKAHSMVSESSKDKFYKLAKFLEDKMKNKVTVAYCLPGEDLKRFSSLKTTDPAYYDNVALKNVPYHIVIIKNGTNEGVSISSKPNTCIMVEVNKNKSSEVSELVEKLEGKTNIKQVTTETSIILHISFNSPKIGEIDGVTQYFGGLAVTYKPNSFNFVRPIKGVLSEKFLTHSAYKDFCTKNKFLINTECKMGILSSEIYPKINPDAFIKNININENKISVDSEEYDVFEAGVNISKENEIVYKFFIELIKLVVFDNKNV